VQLTVPDELRGRVMSLHTLVFAAARRSAPSSSVGGRGGGVTTALLVAGGAAALGAGAAAVVERSRSRAVAGGAEPVGRTRMTLAAGCT